MTFIFIRPILSNLERQDVAASQTLRAAFSKVSVSHYFSMNNIKHSSYVYLFVIWLRLT